MEAIFLATAVLATTAAFATTEEMVIDTGSVITHSPLATVYKPEQIVTVSARRLSPAEKAALI
ncbi:hypothetical protein HSX11_00760 [Oxalobacteraceae bacterium]|nr:hypothetical protein [Oxalobacteraceae bacterium]